MAEASDRLRILTWNIHGCVGRDGRFDTERVGAVIDALQPDVAAFQEVDSRRKAPGAAGVYDYLRALVGDHGHDAWSISGADGHYGQILASRLPLAERAVHDVSVPGREPRKVMEARVLAPSGPLRVVATHLGVRLGERRRQLAMLSRIVDAEPSGPLVLLGDFNVWGRGLGDGRALFRTFEAVTSHASFPAMLPMLALDRICCRPGALLQASRAVTEARPASDHLPVVAELSLAVT